MTMEAHAAGTDERISADTIGFIGLGNMGRHMARRLVDGGRRVVAFDVNPDALAEAASHGIASAASARAVADRAETLLCSLPTPAVVEQALLGEDGVVHGTAIRLVIDLSTVGPTVAARMAQGLGRRGIDLVDAPVSGGTTGAAAGTLAIMAAGSQSALARAKPLLALLGRTTLLIGDTPGQAQMAKLVNNMLFATNLLGALEAIAFGVKGGLDPRTLLDVINASSGRSYVTEQRIGPAVLQRDDVVRFATGLLHKDVALGLETADEIGARMDFHGMAGQFLADAVAQGLGPRDYAALAEVFEQWNDVSLEASRVEEMI